MTGRQEGPFLPCAQLVHSAALRPRYPQTQACPIDFRTVRHHPRIHLPVLIHHRHGLLRTNLVVAVPGCRRFLPRAFLHNVWSYTFAFDNLMRLIWLIYDAFCRRQVLYPVIVLLLPQPSQHGRYRYAASAQFLPSLSQDLLIQVMIQQINEQAGLYLGEPITQNILESIVNNLVIFAANVFVVQMSSIRPSLCTTRTALHR